MKAHLCHECKGRGISQREMCEKCLGVGQIKFCPMCETNKPASKSFFHSHRQMRDGMQIHCIDCQRTERTQSNRARLRRKLETTSFAARAALESMRREA